MAAQMCDVCGTRPAVATVRSTGHGEVVEQRLCRVHLAELERETASPFSRSGARNSLFDELFSDFLGARGGTSAPTGGATTTRPRRGVEQVDVTQFFSDATRELLQRAAHRALDWGSLDLDTEHLLWAAMQDDLVASVVRHADGDTKAIAAQIADEAERGERTDVAPGLSPEAKAALLAAYDEMRELGASYLGPERVLLGLARDDESQAGKLLEDEISERLLSGEIEPGQRVAVGLGDGRLTFRTSDGEEAPAEAEVKTPEHAP